MNFSELFIRKEFNLDNSSLSPTFAEFNYALQYEIVRVIKDGQTFSKKIVKRD